MSRLVMADLDEYRPAVFALEAEASKPYAAFVYEDSTQASRARDVVAAAGACEFLAPFGRVLVDDGRVVGLLACMSGKDLASVRLRATIALTRAGLLDPASDLRRRLQLAGQTMTKPSPGDYYLSRIAVVASERGCGVGRMLLDHFEREGRERGCRQLVLEVDAGDPSTIRFYERNGHRLLDSRQVTDGVTARVLHYQHRSKLLA